MGIPPFGGFFAKYMVISGALSSGHLKLAVVFLIGAVLTILYLFRVFNQVFLGEAKNPPAREGSVLMVSCVAGLGLLSLAAGFLIHYPNAFIQRAVTQMLTMAK
jgi:NADH:ubiquinone oxidoreductase subunit 5 (subunit L)/multisubunit Na+/H+ antiporter MnhA subunit